MILYTSPSRFEKTSFALDASRVLEMQASLLHRYLGEEDEELLKAMEEVSQTIQDLQLKLASEKVTRLTLESNSYYNYNIVLIIFIYLSHYEYDDEY